MNGDSRAAAWLSTPSWWLAALALGVTAGAVAWWEHPEFALESNWVALVTWTGLSTGALGILAIHGLVGGKWGELLRPALIAAAGPLPLMAALFVPCLFLLPDLFPWARLSASSAASQLGVKGDYLSVPWFQARSAAYFAIWLALAAALQRRAGPLWCAIGLLLLVLSVTFASIDWMMSLDEHFHSSIYGVLVLAGQGAAAFALAIATAAILAPAQPGGEALRLPWGDAGNLLLAAICFWMYIAFSQYLIIWSGNLPEEIPWYLHRASEPWRTAAVGLVLLHFAVPFALLLSRDLKRRPQRLSAVAALVLAMHVVDVWWLMAPEFGHATLLQFAYDALAVLTIGAAWMFVFTFRPLAWSAPPAESLENSDA